MDKTFCCTGGWSYRRDHESGIVLVLRKLWSLNNVTQKIQKTLKNTNTTTDTIANQQVICNIKQAVLSKL